MFVSRQRLCRAAAMQALFVAETPDAGPDDPTARYELWIPDLAAP